MASINITFKDKTVSTGKFSGTIVISGDDFFGNAYSHEERVEFDNRKEMDVNVGPCSVHISAWLATPSQVCVDGHLQCGAADNLRPGLSAQIFKTVHCGVELSASPALRRDRESLLTLHRPSAVSRQPSNEAFLKRLNMKILAAFFPLIVFLPGLSQAQQAAPKTLHLADQAELVSPIAAQARTTNVISPGRRFVVDGDTLFSSQLLTAKEVVFKPGSRLIFADSTLATASHFFIVADRIVVEDPSKPGVITWQRVTPPGPGERGQAASASSGSGEGANGGAGPEGTTGSTGISGLNAPQLTVFTRNVGAGGLVVDFRGGDGGEGGIGQIGGDGGAGAQGGSARQARQGLPFGGTAWLPSCESGPGKGGDGGAGGKGGSGGIGGRGGNGGNVTLASTAQNLPTLFQAVRVNIGGGGGGAGGKGGVGGKGGNGGPEGALANFCNSAGRNGVSGGKGADGARGNPGEVGRAGQPFVTQVDDTTFTTLFGF